MTENRHEKKMLDILRKTDCWSGIPLLRTAFNKGKWWIAYWSMRGIQRLLNRLEEQNLITSKYDFVPVAGVKVAKLFFRINSSEGERCCNQFKQIHRSDKTPSIGDVVLYCGHVAGEFTFWNVPGGMEFVSPDGNIGTAKWIMSCRECDAASGGNPNLLKIRGDMVWGKQHNDAVRDIALQNKCQELLQELLTKVPAEYAPFPIYADIAVDNPAVRTSQVVVQIEEGKGLLLKKAGEVEFEKFPTPVQFKKEEGKIIIEEVSAE